MAKKIEMIGNSVRVTDTISGKIELSEGRAQVWYKEADLQKGRISFYDIHRPGRSSADFAFLLLDEAVDSGDISFTENTFRTFCTDNLAFSSPLTRGAFEDSLQVAAAGQVLFGATFKINCVYVDQVLRTSGYSGKGTQSITLDFAPGDGAEVYLTS